MTRITAVAWLPVIVLSGALLYAAPESGDVTDADIYIDFESGNVGSSISTSYLESVTHGSGGSWTAASSRLSVSDEYRGLDQSVDVGGTIYSDSSGYRGLRFDHDTLNESFAEYEFASNYNEISAGAYIRIALFPVQWTLHDLFMLTGNFSGGPEDAYCVAQIRAYDSQLQLQAHTAGSASGTNYGNRIDVDAEKWYWITIKWSTSADTCYVSVYNLVDWSLAGASTVSPLGNRPATRLKFGNDPHGASSGTYSYFDNIMIDWTDATFPLFSPDTEPPTVVITEP